MLPARDHILKTICQDKRCQTLIYVHPNDKIIECLHCGQKRSRSTFRNIQEIRSDELHKAVKDYVVQLCVFNSTPKRGPEMVKVLGLSNYHCKLLSPFLTRYGMDKNTGRAKLLTEMNQGEIFDCSLFGDRAFLIEPEHIPIHGYGKDITGSIDYLSQTLKLILDYNGGEERLIPIHTDGDGHCLVHAISRALVGRELFWHPLRCCLKKHFEANLDKYKELFRDFIDTDEWPSIIEECDPDFQPPEGELHGLRNIHIFGFANVLRRPIILLDSLECMQKSGDYSALFLPGFVSPEMCKGKDNNSLNKPLCIAWSNQSHNHYIPLVGIQQMPLPSLPASLIPKVWGMPQSQISSYMEFDSNGGCIIGGNRTLSDAYIQRLVNAMDALYYEKNGIHPQLIEDAKFYLYPDNLLFCAKPAVVLERTKAAIQEGRLYRCLICKSLCEFDVSEDKNNSAAQGRLFQNLKKYQGPNSIEYYMRYDHMSHDFIIDVQQPDLQVCTFCNSQILRKVTNDGTVIYKPEDKDCLDRNKRIYEPSKRYFPEDSTSQKPAKEYKPSRRTLKLVWNGKEIEQELPPLKLNNKCRIDLNEFVEDLSKKLIMQHYPAFSTNVKLQEYVAIEVLKAIKKYNDLSNSDLSLEPENQRKYSATTVLKKFESPVSYHSKPSEIQYIKVCSSNGHQANYALTEDGISYGQLQEWIKNEFEIPIKNQVIKKGVPPRLIEPSGDTNKQMLTDLRHGDRLIVEIKRKDVSSYSSNACSSPRNVPNDPIVPNHPISKDSVKYTTDEKWESIISNPNNFRRGGIIYQQIKKVVALKSVMHISLDDYPGKVFCYNPMMDSIELCVQPLGHFLISRDIGERIEETRSGLYVIGFSPCPLSFEDDTERDDDPCDDGLINQREFESLPEYTLYRKGPGFSVLRNLDDMDLT